MRTDSDNTAVYWCLVGIAYQIQTGAISVMNQCDSPNNSWINIVWRDSRFEILDEFVMWFNAPSIALTQSSATLLIACSHDYLSFRSSNLLFASGLLCKSTSISYKSFEWLIVYVDCNKIHWRNIDCFFFSFHVLLKFSTFYSKIHQKSHINNNN